MISVCNRPHRLCTPARIELKITHWHPLKNRMRDYISRAGYGAAYAMAKHLGCHPSQVHRYTCPVCEHDAEPSYSTALAIIQYLDEWDAKGCPNIPKPTRGNHSGKPRHTKGKPKHWIDRTITRRRIQALVPGAIRVK